MDDGLPALPGAGYPTRCDRLGGACRNGRVGIPIPGGLHSRVQSHARAPTDRKREWLSSLTTGRTASGYRLFSFRSVQKSGVWVDIHRAPDRLRSRNRDRRWRLARDQSGLHRRRTASGRNAGLQHAYLWLIFHRLPPHLRVIAHRLRAPRCRRAGMTHVMRNS